MLSTILTIATEQQTHYTNDHERTPLAPSSLVFHENGILRLVCAMQYAALLPPSWELASEPCPEVLEFSPKPRTPFTNIVHILTYLLTYLLTPWCRVLLEKLTGLQLVKKFPAFHGTRRFITALTSFRHLSLSWASPIQSIYPHPTS